MNILLSYPTFPETDRNAGAQRVYEMARVAVEAGHKLTFIAGRFNEERYQKQLEDIGVECFHDTDRALTADLDSFSAIVRARAFDVAILVQYTIYNRYAPYLRSILPACRLVFDTLDLAFVRCEREAEVVGTAEAREIAATVRREEVSALRDADAVWVVTEVERETAQRVADVRTTAVVPTLHVVDTDPPGYDERSGLVFLGAYTHSPNVDAMHFFVKDIFPRVRQALPGVKLTIAGSRPTDDILAYAAEPDITVTGYVEDHRVVLREHRVGIAPLRFGAGIKGKIGEYLSCGLPCVTTSLGSEGMGLTHEQNVLVADEPGQFADEVVRLYSDPALWGKMQRAGAEHIRQTLSVDAIRPVFLRAIDEAASTPQKSPGRTGAAGLIRVLCNPGQLVRWLGTARRLLARSGIRGVVNHFRVWLRRPPSS